MKDAIPLIVWALLASTNALGSHAAEVRNPIDRDFDYTVVPRSYEPKKPETPKELGELCCCDTAACYYEKRDGCVPPSKAVKPSKPSKLK